MGTHRPGPGELATSDAVDWLQVSVARGVHVRGTVDPSLTTPRVVA